jgi:hypothetical protein
VASSLAAIACGIALTIAGCYLSRYRPENLAACAGLLVALAAIGVVLFTNSTALECSPAIFAGDGVDQMNYGLASDWIRQHYMLDLSRPTNPDYEKFGQDSMTLDGRLGSFLFLAMVGEVRHVDSVFAYDFACAIVWTCAVMVMIGIFATSARQAAALLVATMLSSWFDLGHNSFFAKMVGYPSSLMISGLFVFGASAPLRRVCLVILCAAAAATHSGFATALIVGVIAGAYLLAEYFRTRQFSLDDATIAATLCFVAALVTGAFSRNYFGGFPDWGLTWATIIPRALDVQTQAAIPDTAIFVICTALAIILWLGLIVVAIYTKNSLSVAFLSGPALLLLAFVVVGQRAAAFQLIGLIYPAIVAGTAMLGDGLLSLTALCIMAAIRVPHFANSLDRFVLNPLPDRIYSSAMLDQIYAESKTHRVLIDVEFRQAAFFMRNVILHQNQNIEWSDRAWEASEMLGSTKHRALRSGAAPDLILIHAGDVLANKGNLVWHSPSLFLYKIRNAT